LLLALVAGCYWRVTIGHERTFLGAADLTNQVRPWLDFEAREFHAGRFPLWTPDEWGGHTLIGQAQPGVMNPLNWILWAMPLEDGHIPIATLHWYWVLIHWLCAAACFALCLDLGCGHTAAVLGGAIYALAGFVGHNDWPQVLMSCIWIPLVLMFFARVVRGERPRSSAAWCGVVLAMAFLGGHPSVPVFTAVLVGAMWLVYLAGGWQRAQYFVLFAAVATLTAMVQVLPAMEYARLALRWADAPEPLHWGEVVPYYVHAKYSLGWKSVWGMIAPGISVHANPHVGAAAMVLALAAVWLGRREPAVRWFAGVAAGGLLLALGPDFPPYWLIWRFVPLVEKAREPAWAVVLAQLGVAVLAALAVKLLGRPWIGAAALAVFLAEVVYDAPHFASYAALDAVKRQADIAAFLKRQPGWFRVDLDDGDVPYNFGDFYGLEQFGGATSSMSAKTHALLGQEETPRRFGIAYHVGHAAWGGAREEVFRSASGLAVWRDPGMGEPLRALRTEPCAGPDRMRSLSRQPAVVEAEFSCPGLLLVGDAFYPGWRARVDGVRTPVQEVDAVRAVKLSAGRHRVEFFYRPGWIYKGLLSSMIGLIVAVVLQRFEKRQIG
jgi:hypothetical protein